MLREASMFKLHIFKLLNNDTLTFLYFSMQHIACLLKIRPLCFLIFICSLQLHLSAQSSDNFIYGDALPDAPALSPRGEYAVGVRTMEWVNNNQLNVLKAKDGTAPMYNRPLKVEIWYPAVIPASKKELTTYTDIMGSATDSTRPLKPFTFFGRSLRDALPQLSNVPFPLIIVSHGYPGSRVLLTYLTENLASKGYVVVAIDHTESTHADQAGFASTLLNRATDILFVLNQVAAFSKPASNNFLAGLADANNTGLIGYSMGGYGVLNAAGAGYSNKLAGFYSTIAGGNKAIETRLTNNPAFIASQDKRIKAVVAFAPWGMERGVWDSTGLEGLHVPTFFVAGSMDDVSGYEKGTKAIYNAAVNADRYLLTYENARHNVAPNPPPPESMRLGLKMDDYYHYAEPSWNEYKINNINQHFVTAFLGVYLKQKDFGKYLDLKENANQNAWLGFKPRSATGLELIHAAPKKTNQ
ncbi:MAG: alpha/beta fold hydrolase [Bacteroidota bacterium]